MKLFKRWSTTKVEKKSQDRNIFNDIKNQTGSFNYDVSAEEAYEYYESCSPLATVIDRIVDAAKTVWPVISDGDQIIQDHPLLEFLENPGYGQTYEEFFKDYATSCLLTNNGYLNIVGNPDSEPAGVQVIFPFDVTPQKNTSDGYVEEYRVNSNGGSVLYKRSIKNGKWRYLDGGIRELVHQKGTSSRTNLIGRSPLSAIKVELEQRLGGSKMNLAFIKNGARPGSALISEAPLTDEQYQRIIDQLNERYEGENNAGRTFVMDGSKIEYIELSKTPKEMDFFSLLKESEEVVAKRFNVPIPLIRGEQMTYSNMQTAELAFWQNAVLQLLGSIFSTWTRALMPRYKKSGEGFFITYNPSTIQALQTNNYERARLMRESTAFSDNEIRKVVGFEPYPGGDAVYKPATMLAVGEDDKEDDLMQETSSDVVLDEEAKSKFKKIVQRDLGMTEEQAEKLWEKNV